MPSSPDVVIIGSGIGGRDSCPPPGAIRSVRLRCWSGEIYLHAGGPELGGRCRFRQAEGSCPKKLGSTNMASRFGPAHLPYLESAGAAEIFGAAFLRLREKDFQELEHARRGFACVANHLSRTCHLFTT